MKLETDAPLRGFGHKIRINVSAIRILLKYTIILSLQKPCFAHFVPTTYGRPKVTGVLKSPQITE